MQRLDVSFGFQLQYDSPLVVSQAKLDPCAPSLALLLPALCVSNRNGCRCGTRTRNSHLHSVFGLARVHFWWFTLVGVRGDVQHKEQRFWCGMAHEEHVDAQFLWPLDCIGFVASMGLSFGRF